MFHINAYGLDKTTQNAKKYFLKYFGGEILKQNIIMFSVNPDAFGAFGLILELLLLCFFYCILLR